MRSLASFFALCTLALGCSESTGGGDPGGAGGTGGVDVGEEGTPLAVAVPETGRAFVDLAVPAVITPADDGMSSTDWDLAFGGINAFTNGGVSGPGLGKAFGPLAPETFLDDFAPTVPFLVEDETGGAFYRWWAYDNVEHVIWSRYHVHGIEDGDRRFKVQVLGFYGEVEGAPLTAIYSLRWAEVTDTSIGPTQELFDLDGTAGGKDAPENVASECLDLGTGARVMHTPAEARAATDWHLCFRRESIWLNGGVGGPRDLRAVDLAADQIESETVDDVKSRTAESELPAFEAVDWAALTAPGLAYAGDQVVSAFTERWLQAGVTPVAPSDSAWFVLGGDETSKFTLVFESFEGAGETTPGTIHLRVKKVE